MPIRLRRGFRKEAEEYAVEFREELNLSEIAPLSAIQLAEHLLIPITKLTELFAADHSVTRQLSGRNSAQFSATAIGDGSFRHIVFNNLLHGNRINSSIMHEVAHVILGHPPTPPLTENGHRNLDKTLELEADHLAFTLLVPKPAALYAYENFATNADAAQHYGVSPSLLALRYRLCDVVRWSRNRQNKAQPR